jgi:hypothetical protein
MPLGSGPDSDLPRAGRKVNRERLVDKAIGAGFFACVGIYAWAAAAVDPPLGIVLAGTALIGAAKFFVWSARR